MSIASEIQRLQQAKADLKTAIEAKGVTVPSATTLDGYAALVDSIGSVPYDAEIEYIQTDGNAYIDTDIKGASAVTFNFDFYIPSQGSTAFWVFGSRIANNNGQFAFLNNASDGSSAAQWRYSKGTVAQSTRITTGRHTFNNTADAKTLKIDGVTTLTSSNSTAFTSNYNIFLFTLNVAGTPAIANIVSGARFHGGKMWSSGTLVRNFIPVRLGQVGYLYDKVSGNFFGNAGSGSFTLGNDVT